MNKRVLLALGCLTAVLPGWACARGVTPYLPLNLEPEIERQIERVMILADRPVMTRPIPAVDVLDALPKACQVDAVLCGQVRRFLKRYMHDSGIAYAGVEVAKSSGANVAIPNQHGLDTKSDWDADGQVYYQPSDYFMVSAGAVGYSGRTTPTGSMVSAGFDWAQLDVGWRDHWWSPMSDSAMLISTEAATMPSVTLSNYRPLTRLGLQYEFFLARMSESDHIVFEGHDTSGKPLLAGFHLGIQPFSGWSLAVNRVLQYGGGGYGGTSVHELFNAFFDPASAQNPGANPTKNNTAFGNQEASLTSSFIFPGKLPFSVYFEYAGEDTSRGRDYLLGDCDLSAGIHFPRIGPFDLTYEISDWQEGWYVHDVYEDGLVNYGHVTGNWFGDQRQVGDGVGGQSNSIKIGWQPSFGGLLEATYRTLVNASYSPADYKHEYQAEISYSRPWKDFTVGGELFTGRDVFGEHFTRLSGFLRYGNEALANSHSDDADDTAASSIENGGTELFVDAGMNANRTLVDLSATVPRYNTSVEIAPHVGFGARRAVSDNQDLGVRLEGDEVEHHALLAARLVDYRYRFGDHLAVSGFAGAARYALLTPAYGFYLGTGVQYRNVLPGWDVGLDYRYYADVARRHVYPFEPQTGRPDAFYSITSASLYISRHF